VISFADGPPTYRVMDRMHATLMIHLYHQAMRLVLRRTGCDRFPPSSPAGQAAGWFPGLAPDCVSLMLEYCDCFDLLRLACTCRALRELCYQPSYWRRLYALDFLASSGVAVYHGGGLSAAHTLLPANRALELSATARRAGSHPRLAYLQRYRERARKIELAK
jgi:hypothetical protein